MKVTHHIRGNVSVSFTKTHIGHNCEIGKVPLLQSDKLKIVEKLNDGVPFQRILKDIRVLDSPCSDNLDKIERVHLVDRKALHDISKQFNVNRSIQKDQNNKDSVEIWFEEMKSLGEGNPVLYFKNQGVPDDENIFEKKDFILVIMTSFQKKMLQTFGKTAVCIDETRGLNSYDFYLYTLIVIDEYGNGVPVACCFSNRGDTTLFVKFFNCIKSQVGIVCSAVFMSDGAESFYNAWEIVMQKSHKMLCIWHVFKNWTENARRLIKNLSKLALVKNCLRSLCYELDEKKFEDSLKTFMTNLNEDKETQLFHGYFQREYLNKTTQWAMCFRKYIGLHTNMSLEAMHKTIKSSYLNGITSNRLDKGVHAVMMFIHNEMFKRKIKIERNKCTAKFKKILDSHERSCGISKSSISPVVDKNEWLVECTSSKKNPPYEVTKFLDKCIEDNCVLKCPECLICIHLYRCSCRDNVINFNLCKHIHAVAQYYNSHVIETEPKPVEIFSAPAPVPEIGRDQLVGVDDENLNDTNVRSDEFTFSSVIKNKILKIYSMKSYPKENEDDIDELLNKLISKMSTPFTYKFKVKGTNPVDIPLLLPTSN